MTNLRAEVRRVTGKTKHYLGGISDEGSLEVISEFPPAHWVEIERGNRGYYMFYFDEDGNCFTDGWFETLAKAKRQAKFEFEIEEDDWEPVD